MRKLIASPLYSRHLLFSNNMAGIDMHKSKVLLNNPVYTGMTNLENSKILMYEFYYNKLKEQYGPNLSSCTRTPTVLSWRLKRTTAKPTWRLTVTCTRWTCSQERARKYTACTSTKFHYRRLTQTRWIEDDGIHTNTFGYVTELTEEKLQNRPISRGSFWLRCSRREFQLEISHLWV